jgi:putative FmdB family regulatory protein
MFKNTVFRVNSLRNLQGDTRMPIFEYKCNKCGHKAEFLEKSGSKDKHLCEKCGSSDMKKLFSGFSVGQGSSTSQSSDSCPTGTCPLS